MYVGAWDQCVVCTEIPGMTFSAGLCLVPDPGHFAARVQKAATPDFWEIGVLIHNLIVTEVVREEKA